MVRPDQPVEECGRSGSDGSGVVVVADQPVEECGSGGKTVVVADQPVEECDGSGGGSDGSGVVVVVRPASRGESDIWIAGSAWRDKHGAIKVKLIIAAVYWSRDGET